MSKSVVDSYSGTPSVSTPGKLFERKRRENRWTKKAVAEALLLSISHIEALENDEYDKLPSATYIIGYWRSYASLLKIDASKSIEFHKNHLEGHDSTIALDAHHRRAHGQHEKYRKKTALLFCLLSVISLAGIWYWQNPDDKSINQWIENLSNRQGPGINADNGDNERQSVNHEATPESGQSSIIALSEPNFSDQFDADQSVSKNSEGQLSNEDSVIVENEIELDDVFAAQEQEVEETQIESIESIESIENSNETPDKHPDEYSQETGTPAADSPNWIFLKAEKQTWLDVRDVTGEKLIYRTANIGEAIQLYGHPPFYVFVGAVDGVVVEYLGESIEMKSDDGIFARFQVGRHE